MHHVTDRDLPGSSHRYVIRRLVPACSCTCVGTFLLGSCKGVLWLGFCFLLTFDTAIEMLEHDFS